MPISVIEYMFDQEETHMKTALSLALIALMSTGAALADPPRHAPAHGYYKDKHHDDDDDHHHRKHKEHKYHGKSGAYYVRDYGISSGKCNRDEIGAVIGGVAGAVIGSQVADKDDRVVGMVIGGVLGAVLGHAIGDEINDNDRACMGHALELGRPGVPVVWRGDGHHYHFTPRGEARGGCRYATMVVDGRKPREVLACPRGRGEWEFRKS